MFRIIRKPTAGLGCRVYEMLHHVLLYYTTGQHTRIQEGIPDRGMSEPNSESVQTAIIRHIDREVTEEADDVISSVHLNRHQLSAAWCNALVVAMHTSPVKQFGIGFGIGWISGYLFRRVSRTAAFLVGCSFIALQGATALGIIDINWNRLRLAAQRKMSRVQQLADTSDLSVTDQVVHFCRQHMYITSGFATGAVVAITF